MRRWPSVEKAERLLGWRAQIDVEEGVAQTARVAAPPGARRRGAVIDPGFWRGRGVLLTGHTGFKGAWLALWLHELGARVTGFAGPPPSRPVAVRARARWASCVEDVRGDVRDARRRARGGRGARGPTSCSTSPPRRSCGAPTTTPPGRGRPTSRDGARARGRPRRRAGRRRGRRDQRQVLRQRRLGPRRSARTTALGGRDPYSRLQGGPGAGRGEPPRRLRAAHRDGARRQRDRRRRLGRRPAGAGLLPRRRGRRRARRPQPGRGAPVAARAQPAVGLPAARRAAVRVRAMGRCLEPRAGRGRRAAGVVADRASCSAAASTPVDVRCEPASLPEAAALALDSTRARERLGWRPAWGVDEGVAATASWHQGLQDGGDARALALEQLAGHAVS